MLPFDTFMIAMFAAALPRYSLRQVDGRLRLNAIIAPSWLIMPARAIPARNVAVRHVHDREVRRGLAAIFLAPGRRQIAIECDHRAVLSDHAGAGDPRSECCRSTRS